MEPTLNLDLFLHNLTSHFHCSLYLKEIYFKYVGINSLIVSDLVLIESIDTSWIDNFGYQILS